MSASPSVQPEPESDPRPIPLGAVMGKLKDNTAQRNNAYERNDFLNRKNASLMDTQFKTFGRLVKYEPSVFQEVLAYAEKNNAMLNCESSFVGEFSTIGDYTTKKGKTFKAHFTKYGGYLRKCESDDETPISYKGYFPYTKYKKVLQINTTNTKYECLADFLKPL